MYNNDHFRALFVSLAYTSFYLMAATLQLIGQGVNLTPIIWSLPKAALVASHCSKPFSVLPLAFWGLKALAFPTLECPLMPQISRLSLRPYFFFSLQTGSSYPKFIFSSALSKAVSNIHHKSLVVGCREHLFLDLQVWQALSLLCVTGKFRPLLHIVRPPTTDLLS